jgi:hypothetical protein
LLWLPLGIIPQAAIAQVTPGSAGKALRLQPGAIGKPCKQLFIAPWATFCDELPQEGRQRHPQIHPPQGREGHGQHHVVGLNQALIEAQLEAFALGLEATQTPARFDRCL